MKARTYELYPALVELFCTMTQSEIQVLDIVSRSNSSK
jgi:hypothetical protein